MKKEGKGVKYDNDPDPRASSGRDEFSSTPEMQNPNLAEMLAQNKQEFEKEMRDPNRQVKRSAPVDDGIQDFF